MFYAARTFAFKLGQSLSMLILLLFLRLEQERELVIESQPLAQAVFCMVGGIILVFYNEKKINGIIGG